MQDEIDEVLRLIVQPNKCRNKLISGENKFVLNSSLLYKLNKILDIVENDSVDIILSVSQRKALELFLRIINNIPKLEVSQRSAESFDSVIDLRKFKRLRYLELIRVCLDNTIGIDKLKTQLETFICNRSTKYIDVIFKQKKLQWAELKYLNLRHSQLSHIDEDFFQHMPWIQHLDLSYNKLNTIDGLQSLDHLQCLNISFNHLERCPSLSQEVETKLEVLVLSNNHISTLSGIQALTALNTLDLSLNWIAKKSELLFLTSLKNLECLNMYENPVSSLKYYRIYVSSALATTVNSQKFVLDHLQLSSSEKSVIGRRWCTGSDLCIINTDSSSSTLNTLIRDEAPSGSKKVNKGQRSGKKLSKPREVVILDISEEGLQREQIKTTIKKETEFKPIENSVPIDNVEITSEKEDALMKQLSDMNTIIDELEPNINLMENNVGTPKILISATVHAHDVSEEMDPPMEHEHTDVMVASSEISAEILEETKAEENHENKAEGTEESEESFKKLAILDNETEKFNDNYSDSNTPLIQNDNSNDNAAYQSSDSLSEDSIGFSDTEDEVLWHVQRKDNSTGAFQNVILVLLEDELKERSTSNHHVISHWPLSSVQSCIKIKSDPVIVEIEFDTLKKDKRSRTYIMEYADAQVLLKKMYSILETRPLSDMNQRTYKCIKCTALFVRDTPSAFRAKGSLISCTICSSTLVVEVEEPRLPEPKMTPLPVVSHSSSQSSIGKGSIKAEETASKDWKTKCSAASLEPGRYERKFSNQKYESDIEVISNPSQSSIEVLDEHSRSTTPRRKISFEEKQSLNASAQPQLATVIEINSQFANLTESSSSGSLTESVITAYEALNINRKRFSDEEVLTEEESSPSSEPLAPDTIEEVTPVSIWKNESDVYSYVDFMDVDARVKLYLYQMLFEDDNEGLLMIARCHLWKTGGSDYDGCVVISNLKIYFLNHSRTNFKEETCDWLSKFDCYNLKDVKEIAPVLWQQGARIQIKHICYMALLMDQNRNQNFFKFLKGLSLEGIKIQNNCNSSSELALQQAILSSSSISSKSQDPTVNYFTICLSITILKDDVEDEILRLGGLVLTSGEFHLVPGELSWLATASVPSVISSQEMSNLIEVERRQLIVNLHFLDEKAALEEVWSLKCTCDSQVSSIVDAIRSPWEQLFSVNLDVKNIS